MHQRIRRQTIERDEKNLPRLGKIICPKKAKLIAKQYAKKLKENNFSFFAVYIFGSQIKGKSDKWSDIDVAVVSDKFRRNYDKNRFKLWDIRLEVDSRIEPHGFSVKDFKDDANPVAYEIRKTGVKVA
ncbi:nucleotidyltransferase domain-containing protein [Patescibacteria group bacterium]|nr:MAG: nucleotidyltransferase domain-containing protein [Patescibacteria group bacterium]